ncbi:hypothetical protein [Streptomyces sp. NBC_01615]|uniref:hypothetical protein n=1 Tax=Streptomyces sp. NBC_01615 TaxID=2975898 RepID=UPI00386689B1
MSMLFRLARQFLVVGDPPYMAADVEGGFEHELLLAWWKAAAESDPGVVPPDADTLASAPWSAQAALRALSGSRFLAGVALRAFLIRPRLRSVTAIGQGGHPLSLFQPDGADRKLDSHAQQRSSW